MQPPAKSPEAQTEPTVELSEASTERPANQTEASTEVVFEVDMEEEHKQYDKIFEAFARKNNFTPFDSS